MFEPEKLFDQETFERLQDLAKQHPDEFYKIAKRKYDSLEFFFKNLVGCQFIIDYLEAHNTRPSLEIRDEHDKLLRFFRLQFAECHTYYPVESWSRNGACSRRAFTCYPKKKIPLAHRALYKMKRDKLKYEELDNFNFIHKRKI